MVNAKIKELTIILVTTIVLSLTILFTGGKEIQGQESFLTLFPIAFISFLVIICLSILTKKIVAYKYESDITTKFWEFYRYGFKKGSHLQRPTPMIWLPIIITLFTGGSLWWLGVLEFDIKPRPERVSKRHGLYRFSEMTEWHIAIISLWGVIACLVMSVIGYLIGFEYFAKLATYYAVWSIIPISNLDGTKIFFGARVTWTIITIITLLFFAAAVMI